MMGIISFLKNLFKLPRKKKKARIKCRNCGHNISKRSGRWWHHSFKTGDYPLEDDQGQIIRKKGYHIYKIKCGYKGCKCKKPLPKIRRKNRGI